MGVSIMLSRMLSNQFCIQQNQNKQFCLGCFIDCRTILGCIIFPPILGHSLGEGDLALCMSPVSTIWIKRCPTALFLDVVGYKSHFLAIVTSIKEFQKIITQVDWMPDSYRIPPSSSRGLQILPGKSELIISPVCSSCAADGTCLQFLMTSGLYKSLVEIMCSMALRPFVALKLTEPQTLGQTEIHSH